LFTASFCEVSFVGTKAAPRHHVARDRIGVLAHRLLRDRHGAEVDLRLRPLVVAAFDADFQCKRLGGSISSATERSIIAICAFAMPTFLNVSASSRSASSDCYITAASISGEAKFI